jgi:N-acyl-D-amino-acid deacylase
MNRRTLLAAGLLLTAGAAAGWLAGGGKPPPAAGGEKAAPADDKAAAKGAPEPPPERTVGPLPVTGKGAAVFDPLDEAAVKILCRHGIVGGALAITKDGRLVLARGYGWADWEQGQPARPDTLFGLASVSKVFTTLAVLRLVEDKKLSLDDKAFEILKHLKPPRGAAADPRLGKITIRHLLNHSGGWNRNVSGDPLYWSQQVAQALQVRMPVTEEQLIRYVIGRPLDFDPGADAQYSNFGFIALGQIVAQVSGESYEEYVRENVLEPAGVKRAFLHGVEPRYFPGESRRYLTGTTQTLPPYNLPISEASGGWTASAVDLARVLTALDGSRGKPLLGAALREEMLAPPPPPLKPREDGSWFGLGWDVVQKLPAGYGYKKGGSWPGVRAGVKHRVDGINTVVLCNAMMEPDIVDAQAVSEAAREIFAAVEELKEWPDQDLFNDYP